MHRLNLWDDNFSKLEPSAAPINLKLTIPGTRICTEGGVPLASPAFLSQPGMHSPLPAESELQRGAKFKFLSVHPKVA